MYDNEITRGWQQCMMWDRYGCSKVNSLPTTLSYNSDLLCSISPTTNILFYNCVANVIPFFFFFVFFSYLLSWIFSLIATLSFISAHLIVVCTFFYTTIFQLPTIIPRAFFRNNWYGNMIIFKCFKIRICCFSSHLILIILISNWMRRLREQACG